MALCREARASLARTPEKLEALSRAHVVDAGALGYVYLLEGMLREIQGQPVPEMGEEVATDDPAVFITGREFGRVLFGAPTIYLTLPLSCAHWAMIRGWAEPHFSSSFGLVPPGVMVVYTPRDEHEVTVCRSLFWVSYNFSLRERTLRERRKDSAEWFCVSPNGKRQEPAAVAE